MTEAGSPSIQSPDYWWYRARAQLLETVLSEHVGEPRRLLDVGSADGPSVSWLRGHGKQVALDVDPRGLGPGGVCGSALELPFGDEVFDVVAAFDVIEHCEPEEQALAEVFRVLSPGGRFLMSVPAYQWAWTHFDEHNHHFRRYTRARATRALRASGFEILRATHIFGSTFPMFAANRLRTRLQERGRDVATLDPDAVPGLPHVPPAVEKALLGLADLDRWVLRSRDLPFGSSVVVAARKPY
ncbi:methyltransferase family protein [Kribbella voronezhensis]|uniref:Methyltransferase family protein n=1 Tax=Kribbella voronezhensis TaxID=2512212 RepID=A0A4R7TBE1_9ACTN|nr:class I SAM-dependent methyltransferase [Kribbella voronezhensis]TDU89344.1 methyltransferase family protein [Kribbella voronezhensis]